MPDPSADASPDAIPLETETTVSGALDAGIDHRPRIPEPLPVRLVAVEDVRLPAPADVDDRLDGFYVGLLQFERLPGELAYRADNFTLRFVVSSERPVVHESMRMLGVEVMSLTELERKLIEAEIEYARQRGLSPGRDALVLLDPAGNWIEIAEIKLVT